MNVSAKQNRCGCGVSRVLDGKRVLCERGKGRAILSSERDMSSFTYGGRTIRFRTSPRLTCYKSVISWENGFIEVMAQYGEKEVEDYIDLTSILENLYIDPEAYLAPIKKVEVSYV